MLNTVCLTLSESDKVGLRVVSRGNWANIIWIDTGAPLLVNDCFQYNLVIDAADFKLEC